MSDVMDFLGDGIPYDLRDYWKKTKMLCLICHVFRGGEYDDEAMAIYNKLSIKFRLSLYDRFFEALRAFARFKPELLNSKDDFDNYAIAYKYSCFRELQAEIEQDMAGQSPEAIEDKEKVAEREVAFLAFKENNNQDKKFMDFLG